MSLTQFIFLSFFMTGPETMTLCVVCFDGFVFFYIWVLFINMFGIISLICYFCCSISVPWKPHDKQYPPLNLGENLGAVSIKGLRVRAYLRDALKDLKDANSNLGTKFWLQFYGDFPSLMLGCIQGLPDPPPVVFTNSRFHCGGFAEGYGRKFCAEVGRPFRFGFGEH
jgi:hypothetical protein